MSELLSIIVSASLFHVAALFTGTEPTRYYLHGVFVEPHPEKGVTLTATDGRRLISIHDENGIADRSAVITVDKRSLASLKPRRARGDTSTIGDTLEFTSLGEANLLQAKVFNRTGSLKALFLARDSCFNGANKNGFPTFIDGRYVDYHRVIPRLVINRPGPARVSFNADYLATFTTATKLLQVAADSIWMHDHPVIYFGENEGDPCLIQLGPDNKAFGVLMPTNAMKCGAFMEWYRPRTPKGGAV